MYIRSCEYDQKTIKLTSILSFSKSVLWKLQDELCVAPKWAANHAKDYANVCPEMILPFHFSGQGHIEKHLLLQVWPQDSLAQVEKLGIAMLKWICTKWKEIYVHLFHARRSTQRQRCASVNALFHVCMSMGKRSVNPSWSCVCPLAPIHRDRINVFWGVL